MSARGAIALVSLVVLGGGGYWLYASASLLEIHNVPAVYGRRTASLSANITGEVSGAAGRVEYRLNDGPWRPAGQGGLRAPPPLFVVEIPATELREGRNRAVLRAQPLGRAAEEQALEFEYDPAPVRPPLRIDWKDADLEAQDGRWESVRVKDEWRVRPVPGYEDYDRILLVCGALAGGRRVTTTMTFRKRTGASNKPFGFGVLPCWGGHLDTFDEVPRRGWRFALFWYYSNYNAVGAEISAKDGGAPYDWVSSYRFLKLRPGARYRVVAECFAETDGTGKHRRQRLRGKWWIEGEPEPAAWVELKDTDEVPLPPQEYAVALVAHRAQVEFGPVLVERIP